MNQSGEDENVAGLSYERLPRGWFTSCGRKGFWDAALASSTYGLIPFDDLPPLAQVAKSWDRASIPDLPAGDCPLQFEHFEGDVGETLHLLRRDAGALGIELPHYFMEFMSSREVHSRIPTNTACYLDLSTRLIDMDGLIGAKLLRFMNDQQCVLIWYLCLRADKPASVVLACPDWRDEEPGDTLDDIIVPKNLTICAMSFEEFICRFWIENTIWYALEQNRDLTDALDSYRRAAVEWSNQNRG